jgi:leucyl-tRNA synthetase
MAVPAHDERDFEFARKFDLEILRVVASAEGESTGLESAFCQEGVAVNSGFLDGLHTPEAKEKMIAWLEEKGLGTGSVKYKLRDWLFARQRYWGEPFPIVWENGKHRALSESELPVLPPDLEDFKPTGTIDPPLSKAKDWVAYSASAKRELNTMPQWAGSCWYFLRYCDPKNSERFISREAEKYWMGANGNPGGVDLYVGGTEHAVLHLLYSRFWHKVLFDLGHLTTPEPFQKLVNQGLIMGEDGQKMSKSRGNVVNPDAVVEEYGADSLRLYEMFMGPLEQVKPWSMKGVEGVHRFLARVWRLVMEENQEGAWVISPRLAETPPDEALNVVLQQTIKKVGEDVEKLSFNTAISQMMICTNALTEAPQRPISAIATLLELLSPFAPHLAEELWWQLRQHFAFLGAPGRENAVLLSEQPWPQFDEGALVLKSVEIAVQINGKLRDKLTIAAEATKEATEAAAQALPKIALELTGKQIVKVVVVPGRIVNIVAK